MSNFLIKMQVSRLPYSKLGATGIETNALLAKVLTSQQGGRKLAAAKKAVAMIPGAYTVYQLRSTVTASTTAGILTQYIKPYISHIPSIASRMKQSGFTLVEVLLCLAMLGLIMLPFTAMMTSVASSSRGAYLQSTRTIMLNSLRNETTPTDPNYVANFTDSSVNTSISDTGQTMPFRRTVDTTTANATNSFKRTTLFYLYTNSTDASSAPRYKATVINYPKSIRIHFYGNGGIIDSLNRYWYMDSNLYSSTNKIPGQVSSYATSYYPSNDIVNTSNNDDFIYQPDRTTSTDNFAADVENGAYTVKIYNAETYSGITSSNRRLYNFTLEGVQMNNDGPFSTYEATGGANRAMIMMYDVNVSDGTLNFTCSIDSSSDDPNCNLHGIEIIKRMQ